MNEEVQNKEVQNKEAQDQDREEHIYKPAWRSFCLHIVAMVACFVLVVFVSLNVSMDAIYQKVLWGFFVLFVLAVFGDMFFKRLGTMLIVRFDEVAFEKGILKRDSIEIGMRNVRTVQVTQRLMQRLLNVGDIAIASSGTDVYEIRVADMPSPHDIRNQIQERARVKDKQQANGVNGERNGAA